MCSASISLASPTVRGNLGATEDKLDEKEVIAQVSPHSTFTKVLR